MEQPEKADLLYGATAIAEFLGLTEAQVYHLAKTIPTFKIGSRVCARRAELVEWLTSQGRMERSPTNG